MIQKWGEEKAKKIIISRTHNYKFREASKESLNRLILPLEKFLQEKNIKYNYYLYGVKGNREISLFDETTKSIYYYDLCILDKKIIVEYHGKFWHPKKNFTDDEILNFEMSYGKNYRNSLLKDENKKRVVLEHEFKYYVVWSDYSNEKISEIIEEICEQCRQI